MRFLLILFALPLLAQDPPDKVMDKAWEILNRARHDGNPAKRTQALIAMSVMRPQGKAATAVEDALDDADYAIRATACNSLGKMKSTPSIDKLKAALNDKSAEVVFAAAKALSEIGDPVGRQILIAVLLGEQADSSNFFTSSMHQVKQTLKEPHALVMLGVKQGVGFVPGPFGYALPVAEGLMADNNSSGKTIAAALLARDASEETILALRQALNDKNWTVRAAAARALALADRKEALDEVTSLLYDKREEMTYSAAAAVIRLKQPAVGPGPGPRSRP